MLLLSSIPLQVWMSFARVGAYHMAHPDMSQAQLLDAISASQETSSRQSDWADLVTQHAIDTWKNATNLNVAILRLVTA